MPMKMKNMKGIDLSCASLSSIAVCSSIDQSSMIKNSTKSLQRLNTYLGDHYKTLTNNINNPYSPSRVPCISHLPFNPRPSSFSNYRENGLKITSIVDHSDVITRRRSSADVMDIKRYNTYKLSHDYDTSNSSRYLLGESKCLDSLSKSEDNTRNYCTIEKNDTPVFGYEGRRSTSEVETRRFGLLLDGKKEKIRKHFSLINVGGERRSKLGMNQRNAGETNWQKTEKSMGYSRNDSLFQNSSSFALSRDQVVVLRVSLHCKGCEGKLRKHLSKMAGVTSFSIDMETKKVTVIGKVTPLAVLTSISKVKNAQLWPSQASNSSTSSSSSSSEI